MNGRSWKVALGASLVLNVFLVGAIAGGAYQLFAAHGAVHVAQGQAQAQPRALRFAADDLTAEQQKAFVDGLKHARRDGRELTRESREGRREVLRLMAAPQLDRAALDSALARTRQADMALRTLVEASVADFAASLSPDDRVKFADGLKQDGQWREPPHAQAKQNASQAGGPTASQSTAQ